MDGDRHQLDQLRPLLCRVVLPHACILQARRPTRHVRFVQRLHAAESKLAARDGDSDPRFGNGRSANAELPGPVFDPLASVLGVSGTDIVRRMSLEVSVSPAAANAPGSLHLIDDFAVNISSSASAGENEAAQSQPVSRKQLRREQVEIVSAGVWRVLVKAAVVAAVLGLIYRLIG